MQLGAGFLPGFLDGTPLPAGVRFVEMGAAQLVRWPHADVAVSLHLARTPITEDDATQQIFVDYVGSLTQRHPIVSVGVHLSGARSEGIGRLGFSTHYSATRDEERQAARFLDAMAAQGGVPVWIENANFYSPDVDAVHEVWRSIGRLVAGSRASLIVDLTHLWIDAHNLGQDARQFLDMVSWDRVAEVHLSGATTGRDGCMHDGHSRPVHEAVWALLDVVRPALRAETICTLEHTDPEWHDKADAYAADFCRLRDAVPAATLPPVMAPQSSYAAQAERYALSNVERIVMRRLPRLATALQEGGLALKPLLERWIRQATAVEGRRLVFSYEELPPAERAAATPIVDGFARYAEEVLHAHRA